MLNVKSEKDGVIIEAEGTTKEIFEAAATVVAGVYKQSVQSAKEYAPHIPLPMVQGHIRSKLIDLISMALVASDEELLEAETKKDIKSADFTQDEPMSFSEFMQKLMGMMEDKDEHGNKST